MTDQPEAHTQRISADQVPEAIDWHDGMLLTSEHFRLMSQRGEMLSRYGFSYSHPYAWGVVSASFDPTALSDRKLAISRLEAIMPDGHLISIGVHETSGIALDLNLFKDQLTTGAANVYITLAGRSEPARNGSSTSGNGTLDVDQIFIPRVKHSFNLHIGDTPAGKVRLPIARIHFDDGSFAFSEYVPPSLSVPVHSPVGLICSDICAHIREKAQFLVNRLADPAVEANSSLEMKARSQLQGLVSALPAFEALLVSGISHPYDLYVALCNLAGHIAGIASDPIPPVFSRYDHTDIVTSFRGLSLYVLRTLEQGISEKWDVLPFTFVNGVFTLNPVENWQIWVRGDKRPRVSSGLALGLRFGTEVSKESAIRWGQTCRIGARTLMPSLIERRVLGVARTPVNSLEDYYAPKDVTMFALQPDPEIIKPGEELLVDNRQEPNGPVQVLLYSLKLDS
jgi:type VI secretion system protein ImpJ